MYPTGMFSHPAAYNSNKAIKLLSHKKGESPMKNRIQSPIDDLHLIAKLADLKEDQYQTSLLLSAVTELLIDKGIITRDEIRDKTARLDAIYAAGAAPTASMNPADITITSQHQPQ
jgi:hypothetical protein